MGPTAALLAGLAAGFAVAVQVGAVSLLLVEAAVAGGPRRGLASGLGVATVDFAFGAAAAAAGGTAGAVLAGWEREIRVVAAVFLASIAVHGLVTLRRGGPDAGPAQPGAGASGGGTARGHYARFLAITAANPLTIASFAAVAASLALAGPAAAAAFAAGVGLGSGAWHVVLTLAAGHAGRWLTPRVRSGLAIGGRIAVLAVAVQLVVAP